MHPKLRHLLNQHVVAGLHKQLRLQAVVGQRPWTFDLPTSTLRFGDDLAFATQVLGTESERSKTWLWSWANEESQMPPECVKAALKLRAIGTGSGIDELAAPQLPTKSVSAQDLALVATGLFGAGGFYRGPYEGGAIWLMLVDQRLAAREPIDAQMAIAHFTQAIMDLPITDHATAFSGYMQWLEWSFSRTAATALVAIDPAGRQVTAEFDAHHRLVSLTAAA
ncbi:MAG: hypothetical protein H0W83_01845 [Planctomycetes bacterium]|nr:hypothetical protein [Planctomycetota bacterium]